MRSISLRFAVLTLTSSLLVVFAACSGKSNDEPRFDPNRADELAHAMMPQPAVFPGTGWEVVAEDEFDDSEDDTSLTPDACKDIEKQFGSTDDLIDEDPRGRAKTEYQLKHNADDPFAIPAGIDVEIEIHDDSDGLTQALAGMKDLFGHEDFDDCMNAVLLQEMESDPVEEGVNIEMKVADAEVPAPRNGATMAFDASIDAAGIVTVDMRVRFFFWRVGNAAITVMFTGAKADLTDEFMRTALDRIDGSAIIAAKH